MKRKLGSNSTSVTLPVFVLNSSTGAGLGSLVFNTSSLVGEYRREGQATWTSITLTTATLGTFASGGWIADGALSGAYEVGVPNAALASGGGARWAEVRYYGAANMTPVLIEIELDLINYQDGVRAGLTGLANAVPGAAGGLTIAGTNAATTFAALTVTTTTTLTGAVGLGSTLGVTGAVTFTAGLTSNITGTLSNVTTTATTTALTTLPAIPANWLTAAGLAASATAAISTAILTDTTSGDLATVGSLGHIVVTQLGGTFTSTGSSVFNMASLVNAPTGGSAPTAVAIASAVWQDAAGGDFTVPASIGKSLFTGGALPGATGGLFVAGTNAATTVSIFTSTFTGSLTGAVNSVTTPVTINFPQIDVTGTVAASPAPTAVAFTITMDTPLDAGTLAGDFTINGFLTFTSGPRLPFPGKIIGAVINSTSSVALTFATNTFAALPVAGNKVMVSG